MTYLMLPAYNESQSICRLLSRADIGAQLDGIVVVDDGSNDGTAEAAEAWRGQTPCTVIRHGKNRGLGGAMITGLAWATTHLSSDDVLVTMDADDTHDPALIASMLLKIQEGADVVIASRFQPGGGEVGVPPHRKALSHGAGRLLRTLRPVPGVRDYSCGFRAYRVSALAAARRRYPDGIITTTGFACMLEILLRLGAIGCRFSEVPLLLRYDRKQGGSKMRIGRTVRRYFSVMRAVPRKDLLEAQRKP